MPHRPRLRFLGAAETVTGSKALLTVNERHYLIDCGLFQGKKELRLRNWDRFPINPSDIEAVILTHAHTDHSGYIPRLVKEGFRGPIYCTHATADLCEILLPDTGYLQEEEAHWLHQRKLSKHSRPQPLFTKEEAEASLKYFRGISFGETLTLDNGLHCTFQPAGHILGAASVIFQIGDYRIAFSGDVGRLNDKLLVPPSPLPEVDDLVLESTYGDRLHPATQTEQTLTDVIHQALRQKGVVIVPAFSVGRAQSLMHELSLLKKKNLIPQDFPIYLNSPMATNVTHLYRKHRALHRLSDKECEEMCAVAHYVHSVEESKALNERNGPMMIISASGMATGGRVIHHLKAFAPDPKNIILLTGYQAEGTRGRSIQDGAESVKIHGQMIPVRARVVSLENISAHADAQELSDWLKQSPQLKPSRVFINHGEEAAAHQLAQTLSSTFSWQTLIPRQGQEFTLG